MQTLFQQSRLFRHGLFWGSIFTFILLLQLISPGSDDYAWQEIFNGLLFSQFPVFLLYTYIFLYVVLPFFTNRKFVTGVAMLIALIYLTALFTLIFRELYQSTIHPLLVGQPTRPFCSCIFEESAFRQQLAYYFVFVGMFAGGLKILQHWLRMQAESERLATEKITAELQLLKAQINPDFLFNTLNHLHTLTLLKSKKSPEVVLHLSHFLSYLLYDSQKEEVLLQKEIEMIHNYVYLAKTHAQNNLEVSLNFAGEIDEKYIPPLLLLPFVENAFKEDTSLVLVWLSIDFWVTEGWLKFKIIHGTPPHATPEPMFQNVIKRLDSLYPAHYTLKILPEEELFLVKLEIALNEHTPPKHPYYHENELPVGR